MLVDFGLFSMPYIYSLPYVYSGPYFYTGFPEGPKKISGAPFLMSFIQLPAVKKDTENLDNFLAILILRRLQEVYENEEATLQFILIHVCLLKEMTIIFKPKPKNNLVDNNMLVIEHEQFIIHIPQLKSCYVFISTYIFDKSNSIPEEHKLSIFF